MPKGKLFLIPNVLADNTAHWVISPQVQDVIAHTKIYLVDLPLSARLYISSL
jgi:16S rRNA (cytidine1402-2'-O)-methyltransferase